MNTKSNIYRLYLPGTRKMTYPFPLQRWQELFSETRTNYPANCIWIEQLGIPDMKGNPVYHGDILQDTILNWKWVIQWDRERCFYYLADYKYLDDDENEDHRDLRYLKHCERIGNVYENPELIKIEGKN